MVYRVNKKTYIENSLRVFGRGCLGNNIEGSRHQQAPLRNDRCKLRSGGLLFATAGILLYIWTRVLQISDSGPSDDPQQAASAMIWSTSVHDMAQSDAMLISQLHQRLTRKPISSIRSDHIKSKYLRQDTPAPRSSGLVR